MWPVVNTASQILMASARRGIAQQNYSGQVPQTNIHLFCFKPVKQKKSHPCGRVSYGRVNVSARRYNFSVNMAYTLFYCNNVDLFMSFVSFSNIYNPPLTRTHLYVCCEFEGSMYQYES